MAGGGLRSVLLPTPLLLPSFGGGGSFLPRGGGFLPDALIAGGGGFLTGGGAFLNAGGGLFAAVLLLIGGGFLTPVLLITGGGLFETSALLVLSLCEADSALLCELPSVAGRHIHQLRSLWAGSGGQGVFMTCWWTQCF
jgi:hypothetical protein